MAVLVAARCSIMFAHGLVTARGRGSHGAGACRCGCARPGPALGHMRVDNETVTSEPEITDPASLRLCSIIRIPGLRAYDTISIRLSTTGSD